MKARRWYAYTDMVDGGDICADERLAVYAFSTKAKRDAFVREFDAEAKREGVREEAFPATYDAAAGVMGEIFGVSRDRQGLGGLTTDEDGAMMARGGA